MSDKAKKFVEVMIAAILVSTAGFFGVQQFVYSRAEAEKLETRVQFLEDRIDHKLERIDDQLRELLQKR